MPGQVVSWVGQGRYDKSLPSSPLGARLATISKIYQQFESRTSYTLDTFMGICESGVDKEDQLTSFCWLEVRYVVLRRLGSVWEIEAQDPMLRVRASTQE